MDELAEHATLPADLKPPSLSFLGHLKLKGQPRRKSIAKKLMEGVDRCVFTEHEIPGTGTYEGGTGTEKEPHRTHLEIMIFRRHSYYVFMVALVVGVLFFGLEIPLNDYPFLRYFGSLSVGTEVRQYKLYILLFLQWLVFSFVLSVKK